MAILSRFSLSLEIACAVLVLASSHDSIFIAFMMIPLMTEKKVARKIWEQTYVLLVAQITYCSINVVYVMQVFTINMDKNNIITYQIFHPLPLVLSVLPSAHDTVTKRCARHVSRRRAPPPLWCAPPLVATLCLCDRGATGPGGRCDLLTGVIESRSLINLGLIRVVIRRRIERVWYW